MSGGFLSDTWRDVIMITGLALATWQAWSSIRKALRGVARLLSSYGHSQASYDVSYGDLLSDDDRATFRRFVAAVATAIAFISLILPSLQEWAMATLLMVCGIAAILQIIVLIVVVGDFELAIRYRLSRQAWRILVGGTWLVAVLLFLLSAVFSYGMIDQLDKPLQWWSGFALVELGACAILGMSACFGGVIWLIAKIAGADGT